MTVSCPDCGASASIVRKMIGGWLEVRCLRHGKRMVKEVVRDGPPPPEAGVKAGDEGIASATRKWTTIEILEVDRAIEAVASRLDEFTTDDVWPELGSDFPVTKGIGGRLKAAVGRGIIRPTGRVRFSQRTGEHGHGQRLAVWESVR